MSNISEQNDDRRSTVEVIATALDAGALSDDLITSQESYRAAFHIWLGTHLRGLYRRVGFQPRPRSLVHVN